MPSRSFLRFVLSLSIFGALLGWWLSAIPGRLEGILFLPMLLITLGIVGCVVFGIPLGFLYLLENYYDVRYWYREFDMSEFRKRFCWAKVVEALAIPFVWFVFLFVLVAQFPVAIGFSASRSQFETAAAEFETIRESMPGDEWRVIPFGKWFGIYEVDKVGIDGRGGIYFRVRTGGDGIGPDSTSYGFVKKPNPKGSPFGRKYYDPIHLLGDWYVFEASNDFY